jgi:hypothetical protein
MNNSGKNFIFYVITIFVLPLNSLVQPQKLMKSAVDFTSSNLPIVIINTNGQAIIDENRIVAQMGIIFNEQGNRNYITDSLNNYNGRIEIELRGSTSIAYSKKQYRLETQDSLGENNNVSLCGLPKENDWILNGPYHDKTLIRNVLSYGLSNKMGRYASRTVFCELVLNNEHQGLYVLMETVKRDKNRIKVSELSDTSSGINLTGGYIVKIDKMDGETIGYWQSKYGTLYQYHYPKPDEITSAQKIYIQYFMNDFEDEMNLVNPDYTKLIDLDSFVDHFIINELCKNVDAYRLSAYLCKDRDTKNNKLFAGPIWDFNLTFGDAWNEEDVGIAEGWQVNYSKVHPDDIFKVPFWWLKLSSSQLFKEKLSQRWYSLRENLLSLDSLFYSIDSLTKYIKEARIRNYEKWSEVLADHNYDEEITIMKGWIARRINWMDNNIEKIVDIEKNNTLKTEFCLSQNFPNPFNPITTINYTLIKEGFTSLQIYDVLGRVVKTLINKIEKAGTYKIQFDASMFNSGIYFYTLTSGNFHETKKMTFLK